MKIGFVLPCYNEYENIFILINQIKKIFKNSTIIVIDDSKLDTIKRKIKKKVISNMLKEKQSLEGDQQFCWE